MKPGDIIGLSANMLIQGATLDKCSHVAIAANERQVVEMLTSGLRKVDIEVCIKNCKSAAIYERPDGLRDFSADALLEEYKILSRTMTKYSFPRMIYSGLLPVARNISYSVALILLLVIYFYKAPEYAPIAITLFLFSPFIYMAQRFCSRKDRLRRLGIPEFLLKDLPGEFCSSLVVDLDTKANGVIESKINRNHEPRPNDVIRACLDLKYKHKILK